MMNVGVRVALVRNGGRGKPRLIPNIRRARLRGA